MAMLKRLGQGEPRVHWFILFIWLSYMNMLCVYARDEIVSELYVFPPLCDDLRICG